VEADGLRRAQLVVRCGKGTYVRTLAADLGAMLGVPAHLAVLRRTAAGVFRVEDALPLQALEALADGVQEGRLALEARLVAPAEALPFPAVEVDEAGARALRQGRRLDGTGPDGLRRVLGPGRRLVAVGEVRGGELRPVRVMAAPAPGVGPRSSPESDPDAKGDLPS
jgi:tRNA pseudouridine55 synthase